MNFVLPFLLGSNLLTKGWLWFFVRVRIFLTQFCFVFNAINQIILFHNEVWGKSEFWNIVYLSSAWTEYIFRHFKEKNITHPYRQHTLEVKWSSTINEEYRPWEVSLQKNASNLSRRDCFKCVWLNKLKRFILRCDTVIQQLLVDICYKYFFNFQPFSNAL